MPEQNKPKRDWASQIATKGQQLPARVVVHAVEKFGKTSFAAHAPGVIFAMPHDETGLLTLLDSGRLGPTPYLPPFREWSELLDAIAFLTDTDHQYRTLALDTGNGFEKLCHAHVCQRDFRGDWGKQGFANYNQGYEVSVPEWRLLLTALDRLNQTKRMGIILLCHTRVKTFKSPTTADYDRYSPAMHEKTWEATARWSDCILFGNFHTEVEKEGSRNKGKGGQQRVFYTERTAAYDAGNRYGLPEEIDLGDSGQEAWNNFVREMKAARSEAATAKTENGGDE